MLDSSSIDVAYKIGENLSSRNIRLETIQNGPLTILCNDLSFDSKIECSQLGDLIEEESKIVGRVDGQESLHDEKLQWAVKLISRGVSQELDYAKNVIRPTLEKVLDDVDKDITAAFSENSHGYEIIQSGVSDIFLNDKIEELFERYKTIPLANTKSMLVFPEMSPGSVVERIKTGDDELNKLIAKSIEEVGVERIHQLYVRYFTAKGTATINYSRILDSIDDSPLLTVMMYFLTLNLRLELPDGVNATYKVVNEYLSNLIGTLGAASYRALRNVHRAIEDKTLITLAEHKPGGCLIYVNKITYSNFLKEGGSPEALLGTVIANSSYSYEAIISNKDRLERIWGTTLENIHASNNSRRTELVATAIRKSVSGILGSSEAGVISGNKEEIMQRLINDTRNLSVIDLDHLPRTIKRVVFDSLFLDKPNARFIIDSIEKYELDEDEDEVTAVRKIVANVTVKLIADWLVDNMTVEVVKYG